MIEKTINYIWLGGKPEPPILRKCKKSWKKHCPDYKIVRWDETNLNINEIPYTRQAYEAKKYAFVSDYFRFKILHEYGGIYLDVDVKLLKTLDMFLDNEFFTGFEKGDNIAIAPGLISGAVKQSKIVSEIVKSYQHDNFVLPDGSLDLTTVCERTTNILKQFGLIEKDITQRGEGWTVFASEYFCPMSYDKLEKRITKNTHSIHLYYASWVKKTFKSRIKWLIKKIIGRKKYLSISNKRQKKKDEKCRKY